ncbi:FAD-binding protein [Nocardia sp. NPDC051750]|uniref:FAD-binding protein n=1 Tax=Nocardia sp. NPDC051750 TaxID=3364325 RepID=UPI0037B3EC2B
MGTSRRPEGGVVITEACTDEFTTDFGGERHAVPRTVHRMPGAFPSVVLAAGRPLTLRGAGHSCNGQTVTADDLLVTHTPDSGVSQVRDLGTGLVEVPAGMSWYDLEHYLNRHGRAAPVLTDHLHVTVGGTLSAGGFGIRSVRNGMQVDHVERIQVTDGTGASRWCSPTEHPELFRFALGGLGAAGLIERAVLRTDPYREYAHVHHLRHDTLSDLVEHTERIAQRDEVDLYCGSLRRGVIRSSTGWNRVPRRCNGADCRTVRTGPAARSPHTRIVAPAADRVRMWTDYVVPPGALAPMVEALRTRCPLDRFPLMLYFLVVRRAESASRFAFAPAGALPVAIGFGIYTTIPDDPATISTVRRLFGELLERCSRLGGRPYLYGVHDLDPASAQRLYGSDMPGLARLRAAHRLEHVNAHLPIVQATAA